MALVVGKEWQVFQSEIVTNTCETILYNRTTIGLPSFVHNSIGTNHVLECDVRVKPVKMPLDEAKLSRGKGKRKEERGLMALLQQRVEGADTVIGTNKTIIPMEKETG